MTLYLMWSLLLKHINEWVTFNSHHQNDFLDIKYYFRDEEIDSQKWLPKAIQLIKYWGLSAREVMRLCLVKSLGNWWSPKVPHQPCFLFVMPSRVLELSPKWSCRWQQKLRKGAVSWPELVWRCKEGRVFYKWSKVTCRNSSKKEHPMPHRVELRSCLNTFRNSTGPNVEKRAIWRNGKGNRNKRTSDNKVKPYV